MIPTPHDPDTFGTTLWHRVASLTGKDPLVLDEVGTFDEGDGMKATLFQHHLLVQVASGGNYVGHMLIPLHELLDALTTFTPEAAS